MSKTIKFLERQIYETEGPGKGPVFEEGKSYTLDHDKADRWLRRGVAVETSGKAERTGGGGGSGSAKPLAENTIAELTKIAKSETIDLGDARKHAEIVAAIEAARAKASAGNS